MKAAFIERYGSNDRVKLGERPDPVPGPGDLLVKVHAASVNPVDFKIRDGAVKPLLTYAMPLVLGNDLSGVVVSVGSGVTRFKAGDAVFARLDKKRIGAFAELALVREVDAAHKPASITHEEAASLPLVGLTAWQAMVELGQVQRGQKVLVQAGSGGVGTFAIQLAKQLGAHVATTAGARNHALVKKLGADEVIDYRTQRFDEVLRELDFVLDTQGGDEVLRGMRILKRGGTIVTIGGNPTPSFAKAWGMNPVLVLALHVLMRKPLALAEKLGVRFEYLFMRADGSQLAEIAKLVEAGVIVPVIDRVFPLDEVKAALDYSATGRATGKVVVRVG